MHQISLAAFCRTLTLAAVVILSACTAPEKEAVLQEHVFVVNIVQDAQKLKEYLDYHQHIWPEVAAGFKKAGYRKITLYRYDYLLIMTIAVPVGADLGQMGKTAESYDKRCAEWNHLMDGYQTGVPGAAPGEKWVEAKPFFRFSKE
ncbi:L-rhamnose mutarotase [Chitinophaga sp. 22321]|uniref:L-rhamnose mutarotase n=1 Tax=Chitinophaga hostae TaxID=2831022 RepID=A0ABS5IYL9_9BACT|nr:L-rhamnose mutarotase [Chitinophaga hostae]MBS0028046.1 L-rhamnose mutarotase [Chitinophaga hostae]